jgi:hypothetical protein
MKNKDEKYETVKKLKITDIDNISLDDLESQFDEYGSNEDKEIIPDEEINSYFNNIFSGNNLFGRINEIADQKINKKYNIPSTSSHFSQQTPSFFDNEKFENYISYLVDKKVREILPTLLKKEK